MGTPDTGTRLQTVSDVAAPELMVFPSIPRPFVVRSFPLARVQSRYSSVRLDSLNMHNHADPRELNSGPIMKPRSLGDIQEKNERVDAVSLTSQGKLSRI
jgi:hypothetical protein